MKLRKEVVFYPRIITGYGGGLSLCRSSLIVDRAPVAKAIISLYPKREMAEVEVR